MTDHAAAPTPSEEAPGTPPTRAAVPAMAAGRDLDRAIAERLFGYEVFRCARVHYAGMVCGILRYRVRRDDEPDVVTAEPAVPPYSTQIGAAWLVVERMQQRLYWHAVQIHADSMFDGRQGWCCSYADDAADARPTR
jgi:hypothetical protein